MNKNEFFSRKSLGEYIGLFAAVLALIAMIYYYSYASGFGAVNGKIVLLLVITVICNMVYFLVDINCPFDLGILEIAGGVCTTFAFVSFLQDSLSSLADLLNGIQIFSGGQGNVTAIFVLMGMMLVTELAEIISCFMKKNKQLAIDSL